MATTQTADAPSLDIDLYHPEIWPDPWPVLEQIRSAGALVWNERGYWTSARDRGCRQTMFDPGSVGMEGVVSVFFGPEAFISIDDKPVHGALRSVWSAAFGREGVSELVPFVRRVAGEMLDTVEEPLLDRHPDFVVPEPVDYSGFSLRGPTSVMAALA